MLFLQEKSYQELILLRGEFEMLNWTTNKVTSAKNAVASGLSSAWNFCTHSTVLIATGSAVVGGAAAGTGVYMYVTGTTPVWLGNLIAWAADSLVTPYLLPMASVVRNRSLQVWEWSVQNQRRIVEWIIAGKIGSAIGGLLVYRRVRSGHLAPDAVVNPQSPVNPQPNPAAGFLAGVVQQQQALAGGNQPLHNVGQNLAAVAVIPPVIAAQLNHMNQQIQATNLRIDDVQVTVDHHHLKYQQEFAHLAGGQVPVPPAHGAVPPENNDSDEEEPVANALNFD
jgi:hypothetical protein